MRRHNKPKAIIHQGTRISIRVNIQYAYSHHEKKSSAAGVIATPI